MRGSVTEVILGGSHLNELHLQEGVDIRKGPYTLPSCKGFFLLAVTNLTPL